MSKCTRIVPEQRIPASSLWSQLFVPKGLCWHSMIDDSLPLHFRSSIQIGPDPGSAPFLVVTTGPQLSSRQSTLEFAETQLSSHTVPQRPLWKTSTLPEHFKGHRRTFAKSKQTNEQKNVCLPFLLESLNWGFPKRIPPPLSLTLLKIKSTFCT